MTDNFVEFLRKQDVIFATWGVIGGLYLFLFDLFSNALYQKEAWNVTVQNGNSISETLMVKNNFDITLLPFLIGTIFFIFYFLSILIIVLISHEASKIEKQEHIERKQRTFLILPYLLFEFILGIFVLLMFGYMAIMFTTQLGILASGILIVIAAAVLIIAIKYRNKFFPPPSRDLYPNA